MNDVKQCIGYMEVGRDGWTDRRRLCSSILDFAISIYIPCPELGICIDFAFEVEDIIFIFC